MVHLNKLYRNINKETNVLAFPFKGPFVSQELKYFIGDVAICYETVIRESIQKKKLYFIISRIL